MENYSTNYQFFVNIYIIYEFICIYNTVLATWLLLWYCRERLSALTRGGYDASLVNSGTFSTRGIGIVIDPWPISFVCDYTQHDPGETSGAGLCPGY